MPGSNVLAPRTQQALAFRSALASGAPPLQQGGLAQAAGSCSSELTGNSTCLHSFSLKNICLLLALYQVGKNGAINPIFRYKHIEALRAAGHAAYKYQ